MAHGKGVDMRTVAIIAAIIGITAAAHAADIVVDLGNLGSVTFRDVAIADVQAAFAAEVIYTSVVTIETRTNPDTGESVDVEIVTQAVVPETLKEKIVRVMRAAAIGAVLSPLEKFQQARADAAAQAAAQAEMDALPDPVAE
jgi:hypothetical protein